MAGELIQTVKIQRIAVGYLSYSTSKIQLRVPRTRVLVLYPLEKWAGLPLPLGLTHVIHAT